MNSRLFLFSAIVAVTSGLSVSSAAQSSETAPEVKLGDHPAVVVARTARRIDPNTFIVAHPARLQLLSASPSEKQATAAVAPTSAVGQ
ncbi:hypothetical protein [Steroidobacter sp.]|uniref:hypothetical protein n=1 Tax=Steroidobacter sp. TaxID=1978227 RepID=UPI001A4F7FCF|nr:hypothetical protein [Steroidobacter sp.]MBL8271684.1 hypothetical protein [Steroidobacter sp.]